MNPETLLETLRLKRIAWEEEMLSKWEAENVLEGHIRCFYYHFPCEGKGCCENYRKCKAYRKSGRGRSIDPKAN